MNSSERDQRVEILRRTVARDANGQQAETFVSQGTRWASVRDLTANERISNGTEVYTSSNRFAFRRDSVTEAIDNGDRLVWRSLTFDVKRRPSRQHRHEDAVVVAEYVDSTA